MHFWSKKAFGLGLKTKFFTKKKVYWKTWHGNSHVTCFCFNIPLLSTSALPRKPSGDFTTWSLSEAKLPLKKHMSMVSWRGKANGVSLEICRGLQSKMWNDTVPNPVFSPQKSGLKSSKQLSSTNQIEVVTCILRDSYIFVTIYAYIYMYISCMYSYGYICIFVSTLYLYIYKLYEYVSHGSWTSPTHSFRPQKQTHQQEIYSFFSCNHIWTGKLLDIIWNVEILLEIIRPCFTFHWSMMMGGRVKNYLPTKITCPLTISIRNYIFQPLVFNGYIF